MKRILNLIGGLFFGTILLISGLLFLFSAITPAKQFTGRVIDSGVESYTTKTAKGFAVRKQRYYLALDGLTTTLTWYTSNEDYSSLLTSIKSNDLLTVNYLFSEIREIYMGEKILLSYNRFFNANVFAGFVCVIIGGFMYWIAFRFYNKKRIPRWWRKVGQLLMKYLESWLYHKLTNQNKSCSQ